MITSTMTANFALKNSSSFGPKFVTSSREQAQGPSESFQRGQDFQELVDWMGGEFSSARQASEDPSRFEVELGIRPIWDERSSSRTQFFYVEQALTGEQPYRQRVYQVSDLGENRYASKIFEVPFAEKLVGATTGDPIFETFGPDHLQERPGCDVILQRDSDGTFRGSTEHGACSSTYNGADYTISLVEVGPNGLLTLDQGYLNDGSKVWGADTPYRFDRV